MNAGEAQTTTYPGAQLRGAYQGAGVGQYAGGANAPNVAPVTLASSISSAEKLNSRLADMVNRAHQLAAVVGGPFPVSDGAAKVAAPAPESAVNRLHDLTNECHRKVDHLNECLDAMARSLGA